MFSKQKPQAERNLKLVQLLVVLPTTPTVFNNNKHLSFKFNLKFLC